MNAQFEFLNKIYYQIHNVRFKVLSPVKLPFFQGTAIRGIIGHSLINIDKLNNTNTYEQLFDTKLPESAISLKKYGNPPRPVIIKANLNPKIIYFPGDFIEFDIILIGNAKQYLKELILSLQDIQNQRIGILKGKMQLHEITDNTRLFSNDEQVFTEETKKVFINFISPVYFRRMQVERELSFLNLSKFILKRSAILANLYCDVDKEIILPIIEQPENYLKEVGDIESIKKFAQKMESQTVVHWSNRQNKRVKLDAKIGYTAFKGNIKPFLALLQIGEILHIGSSTTSGLGRYFLKYD